MAGPHPLMYRSGRFVQRTNLSVARLWNDNSVRATVRAAHNPPPLPLHSSLRGTQGRINVKPAGWPPSHPSSSVASASLCLDLSIRWMHSTREFALSTVWSTGGEANVRNWLSMWLNVGWDMWRNDCCEFLKQSAPRRQGYRMLFRSDAILQSAIVTWVMTFRLCSDRQHKYCIYGCIWHMTRIGFV